MATNAIDHGTDPASSHHFGQRHTEASVGDVVDPAQQSVGHQPGDQGDQSPVQVEVEIGQPATPVTVGRCCPQRATALLAAIFVLQLTEEQRQPS